MSYRPTRNIERSIYDFFTFYLIEGDSNHTPWNGLSIVASQADAYLKSAPVLCIQMGITNYANVQVGNSQYERTITVILDLYANSEGQQMDLKDAIIDLLAMGIPYYEYEGDNIVSNSLKGNMNVKIVRDEPLNKNVDKASLDKMDRYRQRITFTLKTGVAEG